MSIVDGPSMIELLLGQVTDIEAKLDQLAHHTRVERYQAGPGVCYIGPDYSFLPLSPEGLVAQAAAHRDYSEFLSFCAVVMSASVDELRRTFAEHTDQVRALIEQPVDSWYEVDELLRRARGAIRRQGELLSALAIRNARVIVVPDTSSLLDAPNLEAHDLS